MAVIPGLENHLKVEVIVNGSPLEEYDDPNQGKLQPGKVTKYIEAQSGANFSINYFFLEDFPKTHHLAVHAWLDGKLVYGKLLVAARLYDPQPESVDGVYSKVDGRWVKQLFHFDELMIAEFDGRPPTQELVHALADKGEILISFSFVETAEPAENTEIGEKYDLTNVGQVKEQDLKPRLREDGTALSHQVALGEPEEVGYQCLFDVELLQGSPFVTIKYRYRSLANLKKEHVVPEIPPPTPPPTPLEERDVENLTEEEMREILRSQKANRDSQNQRIKREHEEQGEEEVQVKRQRVLDLEDGNGYIVLDD